MGGYDLGVRVVVAVVLLAAAGGKVRHLRGFEAELRAGVLGRAAAVAAPAVLVAELGVGVALLTGAPYAALVAAAAMFAGFLGYLAVEHGRGARTCACFGARRTGHRVTAGIDLLLLAALVPLLATPDLDRFRPLKDWQHPALLAAAVVAAASVHRSRGRRGGRHAPGAPPVSLPGPERRPAPRPAPQGLVVFTAADCAPCRRLTPRLLSAGALLVDVDAQPEVAAAWGVTHTPSAFLVAADGSTTVRPAVGEEAVARLPALTVSGSS